MKRQLVPIMMVAVLVLSAFTALTVTTAPKAAALTATTTTITTTPARTFVSVNQPVMFTVTVRAGTNALARPVHIWHTMPNGAKYDDGVHTTSGGKYQFTVSFTSAGQRTYHAEFAGDTAYAKSSGYKTVYTGYTITRMTVSNDFPSPTDQVTFTVKVIDYATGAPVTINGFGPSVKVWHTMPNGARWDDGSLNGAWTGPYGSKQWDGTQYTFTVTFYTAGSRTYHAEFLGDDWGPTAYLAHYMPSNSNTVTVLTA